MSISAGTRADNCDDFDDQWNRIADPITCDASNYDDLKLCAEGCRGFDDYVVMLDDYVIGNCIDDACHCCVPDQWNWFKNRLFTALCESLLDEIACHSSCVEQYPGSKGYCRSEVSTEYLIDESQPPVPFSDVPSISPTADVCKCIRQL